MAFQSPDRSDRSTQGERFACVMCGMFTWGDPRREVKEDSLTFICEGCPLPNAVRARDGKVTPELISAPVIWLVPKTESPEDEELPRREEAA
ncbi:MAG: hypothetical protein WAU28_05555 [Candidatus Moraniibacteriota bacterium]